MTLNEYQTQALSFRLPSANPLYALLNLASEVGELHGHIAKGIRDNPNEDYVPNVSLEEIATVNINKLSKRKEDNTMKELGDILWCLSAVSADFGFSLEEIATVNINKLSKRKEDNTIQGSGDDR